MNREFKFEGKNLKVSLETEADISVFEEIFRDRDYKILDERIRKASCIFDLGAHIGLFSLYCSVLNLDTEIFAYEPDVRNFSFLKENLASNRVKNVRAKNLAVAQKSGVREFYLSSDSHNHSLIYRTSEVKRVNCAAFADILRPCDLLKMDIEGSEFEILENLKAEDFEKVQCFYVEYHEFEDKSVEILKNVLQRRGFKVRVFPSHYDKKMGFVLAER